MLNSIRIFLVVLMGILITASPVMTAQANAGSVPNDFIVAPGGKDTKVANVYGVGPYTWLHGPEESPYFDTDQFRLKEGEGNGCIRYVGPVLDDGYYFVNDSGNWFKVPSASFSAILPMAECKDPDHENNGWWTYK